MFLKLLIFLAFTIERIQTDTKRRIPCKTAFNEDGNCLQLNECEMVHEHMKKGNLTFNQVDYLNKSQCSNIVDDGMEQICCAHRYQSVKVVSLWRDLLPQPPECGQNPPPYKNFDDTQTQYDEHPWSVLLIYRNVTADSKEPLCGGVLINNRYVLTSASCALKKGLRSVRLGEWNLQTNPDCFTVNQEKDCLPRFREISISEIHLSPRFSKYPDNDIALLRLRKPVDYTVTVKPICLPLDKHLSDNELIDKPVTIIGWGIKEGITAKRFSYIKSKADMVVQHETICRRLYAELAWRKPLCVSDKDSKDAPQSDSGGPLIYAEMNKKLNRVIHYVVGIRSFGSLDYAALDGPGVYTHVGVNIDWILALLKP